MSLVDQPPVRPTATAAPSVHIAQTHRQQTRLYELDLMRLIAALAVVQFHYLFVAEQLGHTSGAPGELSAIARYGHLGVEFFFMLSGFVILLGDHTRPARTFLRDRVVRLYPTYWVAIAVTGVVVLAAEPARWWEVVVNATMLQDAFDVRALDGSYWSLFVELKFYIMVAIVLHLRQMARIETLLAGWALLTAINIAAEPSPFLANLFLLRYAPFFIAGATLALIHGDQDWNPKRVSLIGASWLLAMVQVPAEVVALEYAWDVSFSEDVTMLVLSSFFIVMAIVAQNGLPILRRRSFAILGAMSYPLYVLHQELGYRIFGKVAGNSPLLITTVTLVMVGASYVIARWIEPRLTKRLRSALAD